MKLGDFELDEVYCGQAEALLAQLPDDCINLTVTSPPYGKLRDYQGFEFDYHVIGKQLFRVTKPGGVCVWVVGDETIDGSESLTSFKTAIYFVEECGFRLHDTMYYRKMGFRFPSPNRYHSVVEYMFVFSKGKPKTFNPLMDKKNIWLPKRAKLMKRGRNGKQTWRENYTPTEYGRRNNIWTYSTGKGNSTDDDFAFEHPAIFPERLAEDHILSWSNPGDVVLDCFVGSGTTAKMAKKQGRLFLGFDISEKYCEVARRRVNSISYPLLLGE